MTIYIYIFKLKRKKTMQVIFEMIVIKGISEKPTFIESQIQQ